MYFQYTMKQQGIVEPSFVHKHATNVSAILIKQDCIK